MEELAEEDSRERGWGWVCVKQGKSESRHKARCCRNLVHGCTGLKDGSSQPALCSGGHGGQHEAGFQAAPGCALA